jgi:hypothetical protein
MHIIPSVDLAVGESYSAQQLPTVRAPENFFEVPAVFRTVLEDLVQETSRKIHLADLFPQQGPTGQIEYRRKSLLARDIAFSAEVAFLPGKNFAVPGRGSSFSSGECAG